MSRRDLAAVLGSAVVVGLLGLYVARHMRVSNDITHFIPEQSDRTIAEISQRLTDSPATRTMILSIDGPSLPVALAAAKSLAETLRTQPEVARCELGPDPQFGESVYKLLFPHRFQLISDHPETDLPARLTDEALSKSAERLKSQLLLPTAALVKRIAPADPLLFFPDLVERMSKAAAGSLQIVDGQFATTDGKHAIVFVETRDSAFDAVAQKPLLAALQAAFGQLNTAHGGQLHLEMSGAQQFSVATERMVHADINRISILSTIAIVLLFLVLFRSFRTLLLAFIPLVCGVVAAMAATLAVWGEIQGLTLALGATLIGVCMDYPVYFLNSRALVTDGDGPRGTLRRTRPALLLGMLTTIAGFVGLGWTRFPGMRELALFATAGIVTALGATFVLLPALLPKTTRRVATHDWLAERVLQATTLIASRPLLGGGLALAALAACAVGLPRVHWSDDPSALNHLDDRLQAEDERVRAEVSRMDTGTLILTAGATDAEAMERNDRVADALMGARRAGQLDDFSSLHALLFSPALQTRNLNQLRSDDLPRRLDAAFTSAGFRPGAFEPFAHDLASPPPPLGLTEVLHSPLHDVLQPFTVDAGSLGIGVLSLVRGVKDTKALATLINSLPGAHFIDQSTFMAAAYENFRVRTLKLLIAGILVMIAVCFLQYRRLRPTIAVAVTALLAASTTLAVLSLLGVTMNLLHVVSVVLILSAAEDYAIFLLARADQPAEHRASPVGVVLCGLCTFSGFGLLSLSEMPALRALGLTVAIGVLLSIVLAPLALAIAPRGSAS